MDYPKKDDPDFVEKHRAWMREYNRRRAQDPEVRAATERRRKKYRASAKGRETEAAYREKYERDPEAARAHSFKRHHGVTREEADRMTEERNNRCDICGNEPSGKGHHPRLHVDHCHETGRIRGMLCGNCNIAIGHMKEDVEHLKKAIEYLT